MQSNATQAQVSQLAWCFALASINISAEKTHHETHEKRHLDSHQPCPAMDVSLQFRLYVRNIRNSLDKWEIRNALHAIGVYGLTQIQVCRRRHDDHRSEGEHMSVFLSYTDDPWLTHCMMFCLCIGSLFFELVLYPSITMCVEWSGSGKAYNTSHVICFVRESLGLQLRRLR